MKEDTILDRKNLASVFATAFAVFQEKQKWFGTVPNFKIGGLALMIGKATSRGKWP